MALHHSTGSETSPSYAPRSSRFGSEPPSVEDDVDVWRYTIVSCMPQTTTTLVQPALTLLHEYVMSLIAVFRNVKFSNSLVKHLRDQPQCVLGVASMQVKQTDSCCCCSVSQWHGMIFRCFTFGSLQPTFSTGFHCMPLPLLTQDISHKMQQRTMKLLNRFWLMCLCIFVFSVEYNICSRK